MADSIAVEQAIVTQLSAVCYPNGTGAASAIGSLVNVARGWPTEAGVAAAVDAGSVLMAVHALAGYARDATRYALDWHVSSQLAPTLTATLSGDVVTFGGTVAAGNTVGVWSQGSAYTYVAIQSDTLSTIASALAGQIPGASASGAALTLPAGAAIPSVAVVNGGTAALEVGRMQQGFAVSAWCPSPALRDALFGVVWPAMKRTYRLTLADGTIATLMSGPGSGPDDVPSRERMFRRDLHLFYDYPITFTEAAPAAAAILQAYTINGGSPLDYATV